MRLSGEVIVTDFAAYVVETENSSRAIVSLKADILWFDWFDKCRIRLGEKQ